MKHGHDKCVRSIAGRLCNHRRSSHTEKRGCAFCRCKAFKEAEEK